MSMLVPFVLRNFEIGDKGSDGSINSTLDVLFFGENGALRRLFTFVIGIFGGEGKIEKGLVSVKEVAEDFTGEKSKIRGFFDFLKGIETSLILMDFSFYLVQVLTCTVTSGCPLFCNFA